MLVTQLSEKIFLCEIMFRGKAIYSQKAFGDIRTAKQKATRARELLVKVCSEGT